MGLDGRNNHILLKQECVPVILSDQAEFPFQNVIDYSRISIKWPSSRIGPHLLQYLESIPGKSSFCHLPPNLNTISFKAYFILFLPQMKILKQWLLVVDKLGVCGSTIRIQHLVQQCVVYCGSSRREWGNFNSQLKHSGCTMDLL